MSIIYIVSFTEYAVQKNVITVVIIQINKNLKTTPSKTPTYEMIETVEGIKSNTIFLSKKSAAISICSTFINLKIRHKKRIIMANTLPGKGMGSILATNSPKTHITKILKTCSNTFKPDTPRIFLIHEFYHKQKDM